jgi:hypothetical protein
MSRLSDPTARNVEDSSITVKIPVTPMSFHMVG